MSQTLYSLRTHIDAEGRDSYVITKFVDGEVESSYNLTRSACSCPAGHRPQCRHRTMLPQMLNEQIVNTHYFWDHDSSYACDFAGTPKWQIEAVVGPADPQPHSVTVSTEDFDSSSGGSNPPAVATPSHHPWRRL